MIYLLTVTTFADTCTGHSDSTSVHESYESARAAAVGTASVDNLTVETRRCSRVGAEVVAASGVFVDGDGVPLYGFRIKCES
ncbi:hypothetical protein BST20_24725 [Mycobacterium branderi]|nr:hypothetical protein BST20_24725 [Mycobacterium branderi]